MPIDRNYNFVANISKMLEDGYHPSAIRDAVAAGTNGRILAAKTGKEKVAAINAIKDIFIQAVNSGIDGILSGIPAGLDSNSLLSYIMNNTESAVVSFVNENYKDVVPALEELITIDPSNATEVEKWKADHSILEPDFLNSALDAYTVGRKKNGSADAMKGLFGLTKTGQGWFSSGNYDQNTVARSTGQAIGGAYTDQFLTAQNSSGQAPTQPVQ